MSMEGLGGSGSPFHGHKRPAPSEIVNLEREAERDAPRNGEVAGSVDPAMVTRLSEAYYKELLGLKRHEVMPLLQRKPTPVEEKVAQAQATGWYKEAMRRQQMHSLEQRAPLGTVSSTYAREPRQLRNVSFNRPDFAEADPKELDACGVRTSLRPHQRQFVEFVRQRTQEGVRSIGLFDEMGLGKTLSALSACRVMDKGYTRRGSSAGTLIVAPKSLMNQWKSEIEAHLQGGCDTSGIHLWYGQQRETEHSKLSQYEFVVTTYDVVRCTMRHIDEGDEDDASQQGASNPSGGSACDGTLGRVHWRRIILDECHIVRNRNTKVMRALCRMSSEFKIALSGTPIQNSLSDLYSLLRWFKWNEFMLSASDTKAGEKQAKEMWNQCIAKPLHSRVGGIEQEMAFNRLNSLLDRFVMRRTKQDKIGGENVMGVNPIQYEDATAKLSPAERRFYDALHEQAEDVLRRHSSTDKQFRRGLMVILVSILRLRQACCHPSLVVFQGSSCDVCQKSVDSRELMQNVECGHLLCGQCQTSKASTVRNELNGESERECPVPRCDSAMRENGLVPHPGGSALELGTLQSTAKEEAGTWSTKLRMLQERLAPIVENGEKALVFSQWPSFLDLCERALVSEGIMCARLDGKMNTEQRESAVAEFKRSSQTNVFLLSLKAGGVGLNLVEASHVFLTDVWWNPQTEQQAFERCHRLGQTKQVQVHRLLIQDSVEERICQLQERKRDIANATLEGDVSKLKNLNVEDINLLLTSKSDTQSNTLPINLDEDERPEEEDCQPESGKPPPNLLPAADDENQAGAWEDEPALGPEDDDEELLELERNSFFCRNFSADLDLL